MKGTVVATWINSLRVIYGDDIVNKALRKIGWSENRIISPLEEIHDSEPKQLVEEVSRLVSNSTEEVWSPSTSGFPPTLNEATQSPFCS